MSWLEQITGQKALQRVDATMAELELSFVAVATRMTEVLAAQKLLRGQQRALAGRLDEAAALRRELEAQLDGARQVAESLRRTGDEAAAQEGLLRTSSALVRRVGALEEELAALRRRGELETRRAARRSAWFAMTASGVAALVGGLLATAMLGG